jgi:hypothetical protein
LGPPLTPAGFVLRQPTDLIPGNVNFAPESSYSSLELSPSAFELHTEAESDEDTNRAQSRELRQDTECDRCVARLLAIGSWYEVSGRFDQRIVGDVQEELKNLRTSGCNGNVAAFAARATD